MEEDKIKILIVDENAVNIKVLDQYLNKQGYEIIIAESGEQAIEKFQKEQPDIILMDVVMSGLNGIDTTARIKKISGNKWVPVIFMSTLATNEDKIKGLDAGGDDYISKPIEFNILIAKLKAVQRISEIQDKLSLTMQELQRYKQAEDNEQEMAYELMESLFDTKQLEGNDFNFWHVPAARFSGDLIVAEKLSEDRLYLLHADSTGHGLTAALPLLPVSQTFHHMARKGYSVGKIARRMNQQLKAIMPINRFVAITLLMLDFANNIIEVWNGGNPPVFIINESKEIVKKIESTHLALGISSDESFDEITEYVSCQGKNVVVLYSDGLVEAKNTGGEVFDEARLIPYLKTDISAASLRNTIVDAVTNHLNGEKAHDDMSLFVLNTQKKL